MTIHLPKVNGFGGGNGGGGSSSFPTIVTDSGSSLPATTGYEVNDTFLNTSDKKIYKAEIGGYTYNNNVGFSSSGTYEFIASTGEFVNTSSYIYRYNLATSNYGWREEKEYKIHFKLSSGYNASSRYYIFKMTQATGSTSNSSICVYMLNHQLYFESSHSNPGSSGYDKRKLLLDLTLEDNVEYYLKIVKHLDGTVTSTISSTSYDDDILKTETIDTETSDYTIYSSSGVSIGYCYPAPYYQSGNYFFGTIYLVDSIGDLVVPDLTSLFWDSGTDITDKTEYADKTNGILYLYEDTELAQIPLIDLSNYKLKAETITISTASVTIANVQANKNYVLSSSALTDITLTACETSFEETSINFTTGSSAPTFTDNASIKWFGGVPEMKANTTYTIVIFNKQAYWQEQENV